MSGGYSMIKLAFMVDTAYVLGSSTEEGNKKRLKLMPGELAPQMDKITAGDHYAAGRKSSGFFKNKGFKPGTTLFIVSRNASLNIKNTANMQLVNDYMDLVTKFKDSRECLSVIGGKEIFMLFLPYASEINVAMTNKKIPGDIIFREWKTFNLRLKKIEEWSGGITYYYTKRPAPVY
jgi:dihydrofolate reductase